MSNIKPRSGLVTDGLERAPARGMLRAVGMGDDDWVKPQIGIASSWNEITPCNLSLDRLAKASRQGVIAGEGTPAEVVSKRGIKVVNDDGALMAAIEKVCAEQAETAEKVRNGHLPAAGALIGAVMKETKGQADAARVRELLLGHLGQA